MNIIELQERLKDLPEQSLMQEMQNPTGTAPQFLVLGELKRRKRMRDEYQRMQAQNMPTVAEETIAAAGVPQQGIMQMARAMAPKSAIAQDTGVNDMIQRDATRAPQPEAMADGGYVRRMAEGGDPTNYEKMNVITLSQLADQGDNAALNELRRRGFADPAPELGSMSPSELANMADQGDEQALGALIAGGMTDRQARGVGDVSADVADFMPNATYQPNAMELLYDSGAMDDTLTKHPYITSGPTSRKGTRAGSQSLQEEMTDPTEVQQGERPKFIGDVLDYLTDLGSDTAPSIGGYEFTPEELMQIDDAASGVMPSEIGNLESGMDFDATAPLPRPKVTPAVTPAGISTSNGAAGGYGDLESRIAKMLADREKSAESDKWLALAQTGLALMASKQPSIGGAIGEAGLAGIGAMQQARSQYEKDVLDLLTTQSAIQKARAAAARSAKTGGLTATNIVSRLNSLEGDQRQLMTEISKAEALGGDTTALQNMVVRNQILIDQLNDQLNRLGSGSAVTSEQDFDATAS